ncbi:hypothetical protein NT6N_28810 [Oceaniferula spumae]|uniref:Uncharacterized protein n=1 Tax=Oceaniferula spumae TaxID=2979115 RepID=A0AAT9FP88_9BACT
MKPTTKYTFFGLAAAAGIVSLTAQPESKPAAEKPNGAPAAKVEEIDVSRNVRVQFDYIEIPLATMSKLMVDDEATKTDTILRARVAELVKTGKAKLLEVQMLTVPDGQKATTESIREMIYPTEYEPPELPNTIHIHTGQAKDGTTVIGAEFAKDVATGPTPTAFETRNVGSTLEIEPSIDPDAPYISLRFAPEIVYYIENLTYAEWNGKHGKADIVMPVFYSLRVTSAATLANGKPTLVTAMSPKDDKGVTDHTRKILVFAKATILPTQ